MEMEGYPNYSLFRIPQIQAKTPTKRKIIAGLIDASGSMGSYWAAMAKFWNQSIAPSADFLITFSHIAKLQENTVLSENLQKHGGGMTNIFAAFEKLEQRLVSVPEDASITIVFISDGQDTTNGEEKLRKKMKELNGGQGRDITMLCLGIQSGFPTKMSMDIRELYHTGDEKIPALYLIEYASEKAFFNKFETMAGCFKVSNSVECALGKERLKQYPWEPEGTASVKEGEWVMVPEDLGSIELLYNKQVRQEHKVQPVQALSLDDVVDCFRGWVQKVQLISMDNSKIKETSEIANNTAALLRSYTLRYEKAHQIYIISEKPLGLKNTFKERASSLAVKNIGSRIKWFLDELLIIGKGVGIGQLSEYDAAKRIGIGTITGKYHQKALALKGITAKDFEVIKNEFTTVFSSTKLSQKPSSQEVSIFTLQNQKEVFSEPDFLEGLRLCKTQYDLVESLPVVGYSLKVKRYDGSMINPWKVRVLQLAKTHNSIDSVYLANNSNKYELSVGAGKVEEINAVLPLFDEDDGEMSEILNTRLFKLAISFMVVQNIDTYHEEAYLALLASTFVFLLREPNSEWKENLLRKIHTSMKVTYWKEPSFRELITEGLKNPHRLFTSSEKEDHTDITKVMLLVYFISEEGLFSGAELSHLIDLAMVHYTEKTYVENDFKLARVANLQFKELKKEKAKETETAVGDYNVVKDYEELKKIAHAEVTSALNTEDIEISFDFKIFLHNDEERRVTFEHMKAFYERTAKQPFKEELFAYYFGHALKGKSADVYALKVSYDINDAKREVLKKIDFKALGPNQGKQVKEAKKLIEGRYSKIFEKTHFGIAPMTKQRLVEECERKHARLKDLQWNEASGMISNACMSPKCKYYLVPLKHAEFNDHMRLWKKRMPTRFHFEAAMLLKAKKSVEETYEQLIKSGRVSLARHQKSKEEVLEYIRLIAECLPR